MTFLVCCLHAVQHDPDEWADTVGPPKKVNNTNARGRFVNNSFPRVSTNLTVTAVETVTSAKPTAPAYSYTVAGKPDYSQYTYAFCHETGHTMWRCIKYLALNLTARREYIQQNNRCLNCLSCHTIENCNSFLNCFNCKERHNSTLCPNANVVRTENNYTLEKNEINSTATGNNNAHASITSKKTPEANSSETYP